MTKKQEKEERNSLPMTTSERMVKEYLDELKQKVVNVELLWMRVKNVEEYCESLRDRYEELSQRVSMVKFLVRKGSEHNSPSPTRVTTDDIVRSAEEEIKRRVHSDQKPSVQQQASQTTTPLSSRERYQANSEQS